MLEQELTYYKSHLDELIQHYRGQYVLIKGNELAGSFTTEREAYEAGLAHFGNSAFLIRKVAKQEEIIAVPVLSLGLLRADS
jgi:hypothetical protein